jgi:hypothetical protein
MNTILSNAKTKGLNLLAVTGPTVSGSHYVDNDPTNQNYDLSAIWDAFNTGVTGSDFWGSYQESKPISDNNIAWTSGGYWTSTSYYDGDVTTGLNGLGNSSAKRHVIFQIL